MTDPIREKFEQGEQIVYTTVTAGVSSNVATVVLLSVLLALAYFLAAIGPIALIVAILFLADMSMTKAVVLIVAFEVFVFSSAHLIRANRKGSKVLRFVLTTKRLFVSPSDSHRNEDIREFRLEKILNARARIAKAGERKGRLELSISLGPVSRGRVSTGRTSVPAARKVQTGFVTPQIKTETVGYESVLDVQMLAEAVFEQARLERVRREEAELEKAPE
jgi:hypothetical protein